MPPIIKLDDQPIQVATSEYPYAKWKYEKFNPPQSRVMEYYDKDNNGLIAAMTSAGKTTIAEMFLSHEIRVRKGKGMFLAPLRALAQEKIDEWTDKDYHFNDQKISICTGDYRLTKDRAKELHDANLIIMTSEMLNHRSRNYKSENNTWLKKVGTLVIDECVPPSALVDTDHGQLTIGEIVDRNLDVKVASFNHQTRQVEYKKIVARQKKLLKRKWITLYYQGGYICVTENHAVWCEGRGYIPSKTVRSGDIVYVRDNRQRAAGDSGDASGRRVDIDPSARQIGPTPGAAVVGAVGFGRVEVCRVEEAGWHPSHADGDDILFDVRSGIQIRPPQHPHDSQGMADEDVVGEESWCCDLEIEGNNNFFVNGMLIHNSHLLTVPGRGDHLEVGMMKFTQITPKARLVLLSATMPNVEEIAEWISYALTHKDTFCLRSKYRPCPLNTHYETYYDGYQKYDDKEAEKVSRALEIIEYYPNDKFLVFAHTKRTGELMKSTLRAAGVTAEFHNAGLEKKDRIALETKFRSDPKLRVIVATPTLAWGLNMPARRVIILGVHRGLEEIETYNVTQMIGRSGRVGLDPQGDAYILLPESKMDFFKNKLKTPQRIESQLLEKVGKKHKILAFHIVSEIHHGDIQTDEDVHAWYKRSLAHFQNQALDDGVVSDTMQLLKLNGAVREEEGKYVATPVGMISSMFYYSPFDVNDLKKNFIDLFEDNKQDNDYLLSMAIANIDSQHMNIVSKAERDDMSSYAVKIRELLGSRYYTEGSVKAGFCYFQSLNGGGTGILAGFQRNLQFDYNRLSQVLQALDTMGCKWNRSGWLRGVEQRIQNGVPMYLVDLCRIPNVGKVRAKKLYESGIKTAEEFADMEPEQVKKMLNVKADLVTEMLAEAQKLALTGGL